MGVWIETFPLAERIQTDNVTPCMGVWIETVVRLKLILVFVRHTLYGCVD